MPFSRKIRPLIFKTHCFPGHRNIGNLKIIPYTIQVDIITVSIWLSFYQPVFGFPLCMAQIILAILYHTKSVCFISEVLHFALVTCRANSLLFSETSVSSPFLVYLSRDVGFWIKRTLFICIKGWVFLTHSMYPVLLPKQTFYNVLAV